LAEGTVNRWRQRLAELHGGADEQRSAPSPAVQNAQNVQNLSPAPTCEHFEQFEQQTGPDLLAPAAWFELLMPPGSGEPTFDRPCPSRRGRVERCGPAVLHFCIECGAWGAFGYGVTGGSPGRWYCRDHRPESTP
jgi:hypothetical protein